MSAAKSDPSVASVLPTVRFRAAITEALRLQDRCAGGGPAFQVDMGLGGIFQRVGVMDRDVQLAADDGGKQRVGAFQQFRALADIVVELRPRREQRAVTV